MANINISFVVVLFSLLVLLGVFCGGGAPLATTTPYKVIFGRYLQVCLEVFKHLYSLNQIFNINKDISPHLCLLVETSRLC